MTWDELVASALVGTARRPPVLPDVPAVCRKLDRDDPEGAVLKAGAALGLYRLAGARPSVGDGEPLPVPVAAPECRPVCSEAAGFRLDAILFGEFRPVLEEWLGLVADAGLVVLPDRLPALLDVATSAPELRPPVAEVAGERGRWLGSLQPDWSWVAGGGDADPGVWATGSTDARRLLLRRLRAADPPAARELLASTWATETPEDRAAFVAALATGLSMDDEPFLEDALDDRRKEVRQAAAALLWRLPESRLAARMAERARPLRLPTEVDSGMARDGVVAKPPQGVGQRAWWLQQLVAAAPLRIWDELPAEPAVRQAMAVAAARQRDEGWALTLLELDGVHEPALLRAVPSDRAREVVTERVRRLGLTPAVLDLLDHCPSPWGPELSAAVVDRLAAAVPTRNPALRAKLGDLGLRLDAAVPTSALAGHADVVGWMLDLLAFRADMRKELRP